MIPCINEYCESIMTDLYVGEKWICVCPVCGRENEHVRIGKTPTEADRLAGSAYAKAKNLEYEEAEKWFLESYYASTDEELKAGYLWWAVKCWFGVEYVKEILYENDRERRTHQYTPIFARFPFHTKAGDDCKTLHEFERYLKKHPQERMEALYADISSLHAETAGVLRNKENCYDVFIAWHDKEGSVRCQQFARELKNWLNEKRVYSFASFSALEGKEIWHFEPYIYAAMATARVFVIVIDDYQALGEKFLKWEIKRMGARKNQDQKIVILFNGMKEHTGRIPAGLMDGWQRHYEDSEVTPDRVKHVGRDVVDALKGDSGAAYLTVTPDKETNGKQAKSVGQRRTVGKKPRTIAGKVAIAASALAITGAIVIGSRMLPSDGMVSLPIPIFQPTPDPQSQYNRQEYAMSQLLVKDLEYTVNDESGITITKYTAAYGMAVLIPDVIDGRLVTVIGEGAFRESKITSVTVPGSVKIVSKDAFRDCDQLETVTLREGVQQLSSMAFGHCDKLRSLNLPASINSINPRMIESCPNLMELTVSENSTWIAVQNGLIITDSETLLGVAGCPQQIEIPQGPNIVWNSVFREQDNLSHVVIPEGITEIQDNAFRYCDNLESVTLPASLETAGENIFADCPKLGWIYGRNDVARAIAEKLGVVYVDLDNFAVPENLSWKANEEGGVTITGYMGAGKEAVAIPASIDGKPVTRIGADAFKEKTITSVSIPGSVRVIESKAFWLCSQLESITISEGVQELQYGAIGYCNKLHSVNIPSSVKAVESIFINCPKLTELTVDDKNAQFTVQNGVLIGHGTDLVGTAAVYTQLYIPHGIRTIGKNVFENQKNLFYADIPEGVTEIQNEAFCACDSLESITLPSTLESIGEKVFFGCSNLKYVYGRNSVARTLAEEMGATYIDLNDSSLYNGLSWTDNEEGGVTLSKYTGDAGEKTIIPSVIDGKPVTRIGKDAFKGTSVKHVFVPGSVKVVDQYAFWNCDQLESVMIFEGVQELISGAFGHCNALRSLNIPKSVESIGSIIPYCPNLTELTVPQNSSWLTVQDGFFMANDSLRGIMGKPEQIDIPKNTKVIGFGVLWDQNGLTHVDIPEGVEEIGSSAFRYCDKLESITLPLSFNTYGENIFQGCPKFKWIYGRNDVARKFAEELGVIYIDLNQSVLPDNLAWEDNNEGGVTITGYTGAGNEEIDIPSVIDGKPVTKIGENAFIYATITGVSIPNTVKRIEVNAFWDCDNLKTVMLPEGVLKIGSGAFGACAQLETLSIPSTVTELGAAFINSPKLDNLIIAEENAVITNKNGFLIQSGSKLVGCMDFPEWLIVPQGIEIVGQYAFLEQDAMVIAELPESVKQIQYWAFCNCDKLETIVIPAADVTIKEDDRVFEECPNLKRIYGRSDDVRRIAKELGVEYIDLDNSFFLGDLTWTINEEGGVTITGYTGKEEHIVLPSEIDGRTITRIGLDAFKGTSVRHVAIPGSIKVIEQGAFWNCDQLESVMIFEGVREIHAGAFGYCDMLRSLSIPASVEFVKYIVSSSPNLTELRISPENPRISVQNGLLIADHNTVEGVIGLVDALIFPSGIEFIGDEVFSHQNNLTHVDIPEGVKKIGDRAFVYCENLESVSLPESIQEITTETFLECPNLKQISGKNNVARQLAESLGVAYVDHSDSAKLEDFSWVTNADGGVTITKYNGKGNADVVIPDQIDGKWVTIIGNYAFTNNHEIVTVTLGSNTAKLGTNSFENCSKLEKLVIPAPLQGFGMYTLDRCRSLKSVVGVKESVAPGLAEYFHVGFIEM